MEPIKRAETAIAIFFITFPNWPQTEIALELARIAGKSCHLLATMTAIRPLRVPIAALQFS
jgi:hypothetical protein